MPQQIPWWFMMDRGPNAFSSGGSPGTVTDNPFDDGVAGPPVGRWPTGGSIPPPLVDPSLPPPPGYMNQSPGERGVGPTETLPPQYTDSIGGPDVGPSAFGGTPPPSWNVAPNDFSTPPQTSNYIPPTPPNVAPNDFAAAPQTSNYLYPNVAPNDFASAPETNTYLQPDIANLPPSDSGNAPFVDPYYSPTPSPTAPGGLPPYMFTFSGPNPAPDESMLPESGPQWQTPTPTNTAPTDYALPDYPGSYAYSPNNPPPDESMLPTPIFAPQPSDGITDTGLATQTPTAPADPGGGGITGAGAFNPYAGIPTITPDLINAANPADSSVTGSTAPSHVNLIPLPGTPSNFGGGGGTLSSSFGGIAGEHTPAFISWAQAMGFPNVHTAYAWLTANSGSVGSTQIGSGAIHSGQSPHGQ